MGSISYSSGEDGKSDGSSTATDASILLTDAEARDKLVALLGPREKMYIWLGALGAMVGSTLIAMTGTIMIKTSWSFHDEQNPELLKLFIQKWGGIALNIADCSPLTITDHLSRPHRSLASHHHLSPLTLPRR